ncbi:MAG: PAS domain S-box protein [Chloroflexi bacterium]|nr:PAS domain S-box protein [Chloroflexota bacterium]MBI5704646.1 PAS domain S-box protein [Chloroflexota bacterium]
MNKKRFLLDGRISLLYLLFGGLWILLSDRLLAALVTDLDTLTRLQTYKGWAFVFASALLIFLLLQQEANRRRSAEQNLRESEERYRTLIESIPGVVYIADLDTPDESLFISPQVETLLGFPYSDWLADPKFWSKRLHPDDRERVLAHNKHCYATGEPFSEDYRLLARDGRVVWVHDQAVTIPDASGRRHLLQGVWIDITERKKTEDEQKYLLEVLDSSLNEIYLFDPHSLKFQYVNQGARRNLGYSLEQLKTMTPFDLKPAFTEATFRELIAPLLRHEQETLTFEADHRRADGSLYPVEVHLQLIERAGSEIFLAIILDITERKRTEDELRRHRDRLAELSRQLLEAQENERRVLGRELHDQFGQMLTALKLTLDMASQLSPDLAEKKLAAAQKLTDDLIARVSRISLDLRPPMLDDLGLAPALLWHVNRFHEQSGIQVRFTHQGIQGRRFTPEIETAAYRVVQEALTNAARYAEAKGIRLEVQADSGELRIEVEDDGRGFDPQAALEKNRGLNGMRERVLLTGGSFHIQSRPGEGTRLSIRLPLKEARL